MFGHFQAIRQKARDTRAAAAEIFNRATDGSPYNINHTFKSTASFGSLWLVTLPVSHNLPLTSSLCFLGWHLSSVLLTQNIVEHGQLALERRLQRPFLRKSYLFKSMKLITAGMLGPGLLLGGMGLITKPFRSEERIEFPADTPNDPARPAGRVEGQVVLPKGVTIKTAGLQLPSRRLTPSILQT